MEEILEADMVGIQQWQYGAIAVKPTLLRGLHLPGLRQGLAANRDVHAPLPGYALKGFDTEKGCFRTAAAKEYPVQLAKAMAKCLLEAMEQNIAIFGTFCH